MRRIYMDHSATTPVAPEVLEAMIPFFSHHFGNPSSLHAFGREAREAVETAREKISKLIGSEPDEIVFTSGGTEADNMALKGIAWAKRNQGKHLITSVIEHPAVLEVCRNLESHGFRVTYLPVDRDGLVDPADVERAATQDTILISIMHANNEIGTIQPLEEIGKIAAERGISFHTDAVQSAGKIPVDVDSLGVDLLSISGHKLYGPKGVGALYLGRGTRLETLIQGGGHEMGRRSGTENVPGIVGLGRAAELATETMTLEIKRLTALRDMMIQRALELVPDSWLNGHPRKRLPFNVNLGFAKVEGESLLLYLDSKGIAVSTGSACSSHKMEVSHVLRSLGLEQERCHGSIRITLGRDNTTQDGIYVVDCLKEAVERFREISALR